MEPEEQIYVNIEELHGFSTKHQRPEETETKPVRTDAVARRETWSPFKVASVCLGLLCLLLLTTVMGVSVVYDRDFNQLSRDLANHTAEKDQLLVRYQNLTDERDQLQTKFKSAILQLNKVKKNIGTCPDGWRQFGCNCYFLYTTVKTWTNSRQTCLTQGADLVIIDSQAEMVFLNKLGARRFWIGLSKSDQSSWMWTDGRSLKTSYWQYGYSSFYNYGTQNCAAFNSFVYEWDINSWSREVCNSFLQWVCEKQAEMSLMSW